MRSHDTEHVLHQYASTDRLSARRAIWVQDDSVRSPQAVAVGAVAATGSSRHLDVGCGTGEMTAMMAGALGADAVTGVDFSASMVNATSARGINALVADASALPFEDASFDSVSALWMLYHLPDIDAGLREIRRVLRPGGTLVAATNSSASLQTLFDDAGVVERRKLSFDGDNAGDILGRRFSGVLREEVPTLARGTHADFVAYLATAWPEATLPPFEGEREHRGLAVVLTARREG